MREIKFRAWDAVKKMWLKITGFETHVSDDGKTASINTGLGGMFHDGDYVGTFQKHGGEQNNVILVQFTGSKDVNGREIFEGDILYDEYFGFYAKVLFEEGCFFGELNEECIEYLPEIAKTSKVIGNIYENPELLEGEGE